MCALLRGAMRCRQAAVLLRVPFLAHLLLDRQTRLGHRTLYRGAERIRLGDRLVRHMVRARGIFGLRTSVAVFFLFPLSHRTSRFYLIQNTLSAAIVRR